MKATLVTAMLALCLMLSATLAQTDAATGTVTNDATQARLRIGNFIFKSPNYDVFIDGEIAMNGNGPLADIDSSFITGHMYLAPGTYSVAVAPAGRGIEQAKLGPLEVTLEAGHRYTLAIMGQLRDEWTSLLIDETAALEEARTSPNQSILFLVNNLSGTETISFDQDGEGPKGAVFGDFSAAPIAGGQGQGSVYTADNGDVILSADRWGRGDVPAAADLIVALIGRFPGYRDIDFTIMESQSTSPLNVTDFLQAQTDLSVQNGGQTPAFTTFLTAVEETGLTDLLNTGGPYFVLAPTDEAFAALPQDQLGAFMADPEALADLLRYHIVEGYYPFGALGHPRVLTNLLGLELSLVPDEGINGVDVGSLGSSMIANGSRVGPITAVLLPPEQ